MNGMKNLIFLALLTGFVSAHAAGPAGKRADGWYFEESFFPAYLMKNDTETPAGGSEDRDVPIQTGWGVDARTTIGYVYRGFLFGLSGNYYYLASNRARTADYEGLDEVTSRLESGVTLGYLFKNLRYTLTYFFQARKSFAQKYAAPGSGVITTDETYDNVEGKGFQFAVGYDFSLGSGWGVSPTLMYRSVTYPKQSYTVRVGTGTPYGARDLKTAAEDANLNAMITFFYIY